MILLQLFVSFFQIGLFSFGGGYAMIPLIQHELERHGWMTPAQFVDIIAISQMTPGPLAVNAATFVGYRIAGIPGGFIATLGVALPSLILIMSLSVFFFRYRMHPLQRKLFYCVRPAILGLIADAAISVMQTSLFKISFETGWTAAFIKDVPGAFNVQGIILFAVFILMLTVGKMNPILVLVISVFVGILAYAVLPALFPAMMTMLPASVVQM
jgi:chromate transporter